MSKNNSYDIQYWIWASLNKKFGSSVRLRRSYVARMYEVNRHDTDIMCIDIHKQDVVIFLKNLLTQAGYVEDSHQFVKAWTNETNCYKNYFYFMESGNPQAKMTCAGSVAGNTLKSGYPFFITHRLYKL